MTDDTKKPPRKPGARPAGQGRPPRKDGGRPGGKPVGFKAGAGKSGPGKSGDARFGGAKAGAGKPGGFRKPFDAERGERPARKPRELGASAPAGERPKRTFVKRESAGEAGGFRKPFDAERGERSARRPRELDASASAGERPKRTFVKRESAGEGTRAFKPRGDGPYRDRPRQDRPRAEGAPSDGERAPRERREWRPRPEEGGERSPDARPARKSYTARMGSDGPRRFDRPEGGKPAEGARPARRASAETADAVPGERIAKRLARVGIASRRDAEELIAAGRVKVNGKVLSSPALNVQVEDVIELDGTVLPPIERTRVFLFHKPGGVVTTNRDPEGRKTVFDVLPQDLPRLVTVGRLDINTEGLLLLTNDGGLARVLELPATGWLRRYRARVHGKVDEKQLAGLKDGMAVDGVFYGAIEASLDREQGTNAWLTIGLREGKNREVKNILGALGLNVTRLIRISFGPFQLGDLPEGHVQEIKGRMLRDQLGERLIEEAGANFEAEILKPFSNEPRRREREREVPAETAPPRRLRDEPPVRIGEGGLIKRRQRRESVRDEALDKLSTKPQRPIFGARGEGGDRAERKPFAKKPFGPGAKPARGGKAEREQRPIEPPGGRKANVWMAPGARPIGAGRAAAEKAEADARKRKPGKPASAGGKPFAGRPRGEGPGGDRPKGDGPRGPRKGGPGADRRR